MEHMSGEWSSLRIVFFDGVCNLCNASVDYLVRRDRKRHLRYASLQSDIGQRMLADVGLPTSEFGSFIYLDRGRLHMRSSGAIRVAMRLGGLWTLMGIFLMVPPFIRDAVYDGVARNRYRWFGKRDTCRLPTPEERDLFLG
jgi:predicted DCC family thiol-disulfide oxidoreductase YuxK